MIHVILQKRNAGETIGEEHCLLKMAVVSKHGKLY